MAMHKMRVGISLSFVLFALCSLPAWVVPLVLERAYPVEAVEVPQDTMFRPNVTSPRRWATVDVYGQIGLGAGVWNSGGDIFSVYNASTYVLPGASRVGGVDDLFLSGDLKGKDATLPGIRINGSCSLDIDEHQAPMNESFTKFTDRCASQKWSLPTNSREPFRARFFDGEGYYTSCLFRGEGSFSPWAIGGKADQPSPPKTVEALAWFSLRNTTNPDRNPGFVQGAIKCAWTINTGVATLNGRAGTFSSYIDGWPVLGSQGEPTTHPLEAALGALGDLTSGYDKSALSQLTQGIQDNGWIFRIGIKRVLGSDATDTRFVLPSLEEIAKHVSTGVAYMANAVNVLSSDDATEYQAREYVISTARIRVPPYAWVSYSLLAIWLLLIVVLTALMYRPTFGSGLDSYTVGRLLVDEPQLVHARGCGELEDNTALSAKFLPVGDSRTAGETGHIKAGGQGLLTTGRVYS